MTDHEKRGLAIRVLQEMHTDAVFEERNLTTSDWHCHSTDPRLDRAAERVNALDYALTILKGDDDDQRTGN